MGPKLHHRAPEPNPEQERMEWQKSITVFQVRIAIDESEQKNKKK